MDIQSVAVSNASRTNDTFLGKEGASHGLKVGIAFQIQDDVLDISRRYGAAGNVCWNLSSERTAAAVGAGAAAAVMCPPSSWACSFRRVGHRASAGGWTSTFFIAILASPQPIEADRHGILPHGTRVKKKCFSG